MRLDYRDFSMSKRAPYLGTGFRLSEELILRSVRQNARGIKRMNYCSLVDSL